jgi:hypothetical protein
MIYDKIQDNKYQQQQKRIVVHPGPYLYCQKQSTNTFSTLTLLNQQLCTCNFTNSIYHVEIINLSFVKGNITLGDIRKNDI